MKRLLAFLLLALVSCAHDRYRWNLMHAYITPWTHLSQSDVQEIVRLVSYATPQPLVGITTDRKGREPGKVNVITAYSDASIPDHCTGFELQKIAGKWKITFQGSSSETIAGLTLSGGL